MTIYRIRTSFSKQIFAAAYKTAPGQLQQIILVATGLEPQKREKKKDYILGLHKTRFCTAFWLNPDHNNRLPRR